MIVDGRNTQEKMYKTVPNEIFIAGAILSDFSKRGKRGRGQDKIKGKQNVKIKKNWEGGGLKSAHKNISTSKYIKKNIYSVTPLPGNRFFSFRYFHWRP